MAEAVEKINNIERRVKVTVPVAPLETQINERFIQLTKTARVQGFRPGKVPLKIVQQQYGDDVKSEIYTKAIEIRFGEFVEKNNLRVAGMPNIEHQPLNKVSGDFEFTATFEVFPEFKITDIKKLKISQYETPVKPDDVKKTIDVLVKQRTTFNKVDRASKLGDRIKVQLKSFIENKEAESTGEESLEIVLGDTNRIKEFDEQLVGLKSDVEKSFDIKYPKNHEPKELSNKTVSYQVKVIEVQEPQIPKVDEDFAKKLGVVDGDIKKMDEDIKASLVQEVDRRIKENLKAQVFKSLVDSHEIDLPKSLIGLEINRLGEMTFQNLQRQGADMKSVKLEPAMFEERAKVTCKLRMILGSIVDENKLEATTDQIRAKVDEFSMNYDDSEQAAKWFYEDPKRLDEPRALATEDNVVAWVMSSCKVEKKALDFDKLMAAQFDE
ncbi:MAG: trigger factor [Proteobacteria bacterium]|mgnify:CR=1 FL=1|jgi:trigger factor|nr:trigger factor [Pseudomonadota bacterium]HCK04745.1 trigger factor [Methylophilaceae bacterium]|tara:strand:+ start:4557 stop:5870 length:1314 start_codon:yes stop_codon:yes gene_type:complete